MQRPSTPPPELARFVQPETEIARPDHVERTEPNPRLALTEAPPLFTLRQATGEFALHNERDVRAVTEGDLEDLLRWGIPRYQKRHPRTSAERMLPLLKMAIWHSSYRFVRTENACGLFMVERTPWEPLPVVGDIFVVDREDGPKSKAFEVVKIYREGLAWAERIGAIEFRFASDGDYDLEPLAKRLGMTRTCVQFIKVLHA